MEENQLKLHDKQKQQLKNQNQLCDIKLSVLNKLDESSCWSDSQRMKLTQSFSSFIDEKQQQNYGDFNIHCKQQEICSQNKSVNCLDKLEYSQKQKYNHLNVTGTQNNIINISNSDLKHIKSDFQIDNSSYIKKQSVEYRSSQYQESKEKSQLCQKSSKARVKVGLSMKREKLVRKNSIVNMKLLTKIKQKISYFHQKYTLSGRTSLLNQDIRTHIEDLSDGTRQNQIQYYQQLIVNYLPSLEKLIGKYSFPIITNFSIVGLFIKIFFSIINCLFLYTYSLFLVFSDQSQQLEVALRLIIPLWIIEILFKLNMHPQKIINQIDQRKQLLKYYIKQQSFSDVIPLVTSFISLSFQHHKLYFEVVVLMKAYNVLNDLQDIQQRLCMILKRHYIIQLFYLIMQLFLIAHVVSCLWKALQSIQADYFGEQQTWQEDLAIQDLIWWRNYIWSLYWSLTLMTTGSNQIKTASEAYFTCFIMLFTTIIFGYFLNAIGIILSEIDQQNSAVKSDLSIINQYMRKRNISKTLQQQVNFSLQNYYRKNYQKISEENFKILGKISLDLQKSVLKEQNIQILNKIQCLKNNFSLKSIEELSLRVKEEYYMPNQVIINSDEQYDGSMFYIISGQIELIGSFYKEQCLQTPLNKVKKGDIVGEINFFTGLQQTPCIRSSGFTKVLRIQRNNFIEIIKSNEMDYEIFCQINDKIKLQLDFSDIIKNYNCSICRKQNHFQLQCPLISLDREPFIFKTAKLYNQKQKRLKFSRRKEKKINSLNNMRDTQKDIKVLINNIKILNQSISTYQKLEAQFFSDEEDEFVKSQINQSLTNESQDINKNNSQEDNSFQKCKYDQVQVQLDSSIKIHRYSNTTKNQKSLSDLEEHSLAQVNDYQKSQFNSLRSELQHSYEISNGDSQRSIKRQQEMIRKNSRDILQGAYEGELSRKKSYMRNYLKSSSSLRTNFHGQISSVEESKLQQNENQSSLTPTIKKSNSKINKQETINEQDVQNQIYLNNCNNNSIPQNNFYDYNFEKPQNFKFYYSQGNLKLQIFRYNRYIKKKIRNSKRNKKII
ncbi:cyclic nucleotide-binding domain protein (macronuclear) [Tetrahymena thermophila SB210]|uniref:Cyclic nucleotide-binding domain protein n=1 Tax=Tetrahymena thermophila (strain SB210) TaxID=312017 RepID=Q22SL6_TETTS|nr:cyclic nucleotide-binding domain protein [Tetrahymena thermophila SB210]EAR87756.2 cyclic nucleotide-binding domain protein [Tetrahymena thermophila SB210]|eukprot:XP_001008001.2 cyclic nucleotide-binding domain protein [Tetrahymena thermophila SB210]